MKRLFHLSTIPRQLGWFNESWQEILDFVAKNNIDGIELGLTMDYDLTKIPKEIIDGVHLSFYPVWLDFWRGDEARVRKTVGDEAAVLATYGGLKPEILIENYRKQYERAKALDAKYMVFHVSHVLPEDSFTWQFDYTDKEILEATIELVNSAFPADDEDGPMLLFENLWWPGLTYLDESLTKWFIESIHYKNKGYLMDVSHLILTNGKISNEQQAYNYIKHVIENLGETSKWIQAVHLNKTLPKFYMQRNHGYLLERYRKEKDPVRKRQVLKTHINQMDCHKPFDHEMAKKIIDLVSPKYCVYETAPESRYELAYFIKKQNKALGYE